MLIPFVFNRKDNNNDNDEIQNSKIIFFFIITVLWLIRCSEEPNVKNLYNCIKKNC